MEGGSTQFVEALSALGCVVVVVVAVVCFFNFLFSVHGHSLHRLPVPVWHFLFLLGDEPWTAGEHFDFTLGP